MPRKTLLLLLIFFSCAAPPARGQTYPFETLTEKDGLPSSSVYSVAQDSEGVMWFATRSGVVTFDGLEWQTLYSNLNKHNVQLGHLALDRKQRIWLASLRSPLKVGFWEDGELRQLPQLEWTRQDHTTHGFTVNTDETGVTRVALTSSGGHVWLWDGTSWLEFPPDPERGLITTFAWVGDQLLAASVDGLLRFDPKTQRFAPLSVPGLPPGPVHTILFQESLALTWLVGPTWVGTLRDGRFQFLARDLDILLPTIINGVVASPDPVDGFFFGDINRVYHFSAESGELTPITRRSGLVGEGTRCLFRDREGNLWFCGQRGLSKLISRRFTRLDRQSGLLRDEVSSILIRRRGDVILGHDGGLTFLGPPVRTVDLGERGQILGRIMDLEEGRNEAVWMAADRLGLGRLAADGSINWVPLRPGEDISVFCLARDPGGTLWVGTSAGLFRQDDDGFTPMVFPGIERLNNPFVRRIERAADGSLLVVAGVYGVFHLQNGQIRNLHEPPQVDGSFFTALDRGEAGTWLGTSQGLFRLKDGRMERCRAPLPEIHSSIYCLLETEQGTVWFGTENGALVWDGQVLRSMSAREGLLGTDTNRDALKQDARGRVWIGTNRGLSIYDGRYDFISTAPPLVQLRGLEVDGERLPLDRPLELSAPARLLVAEFRLVTFVERRDLGIRTWLEGFEDQWQDPLPLYQRAIRYSRLPAGNYRLHLQAARGDSLIGPVVTSPPISIPRPIYLRWWFLLPVGAAFLVGMRLVVVAIAHRRFSHQLKREVQERTRELKESREAIHFRSQRFQTTLDSVSDGVLTVNPAGRIILTNPAASRILGLEPEELLEQELDRVFPPSSDLVPGEAQECDFLNPQRGTIWIEALATPLTQVGSEPSGKVIVLRDITSRRRHEAELNRTQKLESLGLLAGGLAHDFNNLLTIILGNIELLDTRADVPAAVSHRLAKAKRATVRARTLTGQLLTFARGGAPQRRTIDLAELVEQTVTLVFNNRSHSCQVEIEPDLWPVQADSSQMNQVLSNLLINACQAMPEGGQVLVFGTNLSRAPEFLPPGQYVLLEVRDQGQGISREDLPKIFDPYFTTKEGGSGLGLSTAYSIVQRHGGALKASSRPGQGASFRVFLPRGDREDARPREDLTLEITPGQHILVMDDEVEVRQVIQDYLARLGLKATLVTTGQEAVQTWQAARAGGAPFAAAILDLTVPEAMGGKDALARIQEQDPGFPALVVSGYSSDPVLADHGQYGFLAALPKPFDFEQFALALGKVLGWADRPH